MKTEKQIRGKLQRMKKEHSATWEIWKIIKQNNGKDNTYVNERLSRLNGSLEILRWFLK